VNRATKLTLLALSLTVLPLAVEIGTGTSRVPPIAPIACVYVNPTWRYTASYGDCSTEGLFFSTSLGPFQVVQAVAPPVGPNGVRWPCPSR
jgi:hypothetical protein